MKLPPFAVVLAASLLASVTCDAAVCYDSSSGFAEDEWAHCQRINDGIFVYYTPLQDEGLVKLGLHAPNHSEGWSALALGGNGGMRGASQVVVRREGGTWTAEDRYSNDYVTPSLDESQDVMLIAASQNKNSGTSWGVLLKMNSCDDRDYPIKDISRPMHWALGSTHDFAFHGANRGAFHANLLSEPKVISSPEGLEEVDLRMPNVEVATQDGGEDPQNAFVCAYFDLEKLAPDMDLNEKHHAVRFSPFLDPDSEKYVHHMILYGCDDNPLGPKKEHGQVIQDCNRMINCLDPKWAWAVGSDDTIMPDDVGMPFGEGTTILAMQVHYYNPDGDSSFFDSSGVRLFFSDTKRQHDLGRLGLDGGVRPWQRPSLPAGEESVSIPPLVVPSVCTSQWSGPLNVFGVFHHSHMAGRKLEVRVEREGESMGLMRLERQYDYLYQSLEGTEINTLLPGDELILSCSYDTRGVKENITFGENTQDEMCLAGVWYYPKQDLELFSYQDLSYESEHYQERLEMCSKPGTSTDNSDFREVSMCAQAMANDLQKFYHLQMMTQRIPALLFCNSPLSVDFLCPPCSETNSCTEEDIKAYGQDEVCPKWCGGVGLPVYPDVSGNVSVVTPTHSTRCLFDSYWFQHTLKEDPLCVRSGSFDGVHVNSHSEKDASGAMELLLSHSYPITAMSILLGLMA
mmetsp:Transcript_25085/g.51099  ORF Transcript_25085/g.51099 Transcript_25085/m.51099 type:complete len:684 (-) Transcript_25085:190-2241(-)